MADALAVMGQGGFLVNTDPVLKFWANVDKSGECWEWTGGRTGTGYGVFGRPQVKAHRYVWSIEYGPIPHGMFVCHQCDNPPCVRPDHLFLGTPSDNMQDMVAKGRARGGHAQIGEQNGRAKITSAIATAIRSEWKARGGSQRELGMKFGISQSAVSAILSGKSWRCDA